MLIAGVKGTTARFGNRGTAFAPAHARM